VLTAGALALADWPNLNPTKWVQRPDEEITGMDVRATFPTILADDFKCEFTGPISDIHIWGSWFADQLPRPVVGGPGDPTAVDFKLSFHADVPRDANNNPSHPGAELWHYIAPAGSFAARVWKVEQDFPEMFFDPTVNDIIGNDRTIWQYNFIIPAGEQFTQQQGNIYWLDVQALPHDANSTFGWKTSLDHFNDDAVFQNVVPFGAPPNPNNWDDMHYPQTHPFHGQSIDLAFALTTVPEPGTITLFIGAYAVLGMRRGREKCSSPSFLGRKRI
jgi:hypothetical protein